MGWAKHLCVMGAVPLPSLSEVASDGWRPRPMSDAYGASGERSGRRRLTPRPGPSRPESEGVRLKAPFCRPRVAMASLGAGVDWIGQFSGADELIAVISSWDLTRTGETGYGLVLTKSRVIGARRTESEIELVAYLGPGSTATEDERATAGAVASRLIRTKQFVMAKESIAQILYRRPGFLVGGYVVFKTPLQAFKIELPVVSGWNEGPLQTSRVLIESLMAFSPESLYDGRTGAL